jgi:hypothetical protein
MNTQSMLLTREQFRFVVFQRDRGKCVVCKGVAQDAHHIVDRSLWHDGGYSIDNGVAVCASYHWGAETTQISCDELRKAAGITTIVLPPQFEAGECIDHWGNRVLPNGQRLRGELFDDESVQLLLREAGLLDLFSDRVKYPRTYHLPWSPGNRGDEGVVENLRAFEGQRVVVSAKMDGQNTTMYRDGLHARSVSSESHPSQSRVRGLHAAIAHEIPDGWRICGENLFARHSIHYRHLSSYFMVYSIWDEHNVALSWDATVEWCALLGLQTVPVLYDGQWDERVVRELYRPTLNGDDCEGYVVRLAAAIPYGAFRRSVAKWVRADHVQTVHNWARQAVVPNHLAEPVSL